VGLSSPSVLEANYADQLHSLLPPGRAWGPSPDSNLRKLLLGAAGELARVHARAGDLFREGDPRAAVELLDAWEEFLGLPSPCTGPLVEVEARRRAVLARLLEQGGQTPAYFVSLAASLGFTVTVRDYVAFRAGSRAGDALTNPGEAFLAGYARAGDRLGLPLDWPYTMDVVSAPVTTHYFSAGSLAGEALAVWGNVLLECSISEAAPAQVFLRFLYVLLLNPDPVVVTLGTPPASIH
jgi:uncharacterized protein YmfQ (DUF2313 family)